MHNRKENHSPQLPRNSGTTTQLMLNQDDFTLPSSPIHLGGRRTPNAIYNHNYSSMANYSGNNANDRDSYHLYNSKSKYYPTSYDELLEEIVTLKEENQLMHKEIKLKDSKLAATVNSIKTFWSPELKKESMTKREESEKLEMLKERFKLVIDESQHRVEIIQDLQNDLQLQKQINLKLQESYYNEQSEEVKVLRSEKEQMVKDMLLLSNKISELEGDNRKMHEKIELRDVCIENLRHFLDRKVTTFNDAAKVMPKLKQLEVYVAKTDRQNMLLEQELKERKIRIDQLEKQIEQFKEQPNRNNGHQYLASSVTDELNDDKKQVEIFKSHSKFMKAKLEAARAELNQKQAALQAAEAKLEMLSVREANLSQHIEVLQESMKSKKEENSILQADLEAIRSKIKAMEKDNHHSNDLSIDYVVKQITTDPYSKDLSMELRINQLQMTVKERDEEINKLETSIKEKTEEIKDVTNKQDSIEAQSSQQLTTINELQVKVNSLQEELSAKSKEIDDLQFSLSESTKDVSNHNDKIEAQQNYQKEILELQSLLEAKSQRVNELQEALDESIRVCQDHDFAFKSDMEEANKKIKEMEYFKNLVDEQRDQCNKYKERIIHLENVLQEQEKVHFRLKDEFCKQIQETMKLTQQYLLATISEKDSKSTTLELASEFQGVNHAPDISKIQSEKQELVEDLKLVAQKKMYMMPLKQEEAKLFFVEDYVDFDDNMMKEDMQHLQKYATKLNDYIIKIKQLIFDNSNANTSHNLPNIQANYEYMKTIDTHTIQNLREARRIVNNLHTFAFLTLRDSINVNLTALEDAPEFPLPEH